MFLDLIMKAFAGLVTLLSIAVLVYVYAVPIDSMKRTRDGAPYFAPQVVNPETGDGIELGKLIRHYRGD